VRPSSCPASSGGTGAEVVEHEPDAERLEVAQVLRRHLGILEQRGLGDLQMQHGRVQARLVEDRGDGLAEPWRGELARRQVHRHAEGRPAAGGDPLRSLPAGETQHAVAEGEDRAAVLGDGDELRRQDQAVLVRLASTGL